jgi:hypothetical protein
VIRQPEVQYPLLVTFGDIADPKSVALVDPTNLAASFGPGVRLTSVMLARGIGAVRCSAPCE